MSIEVVRRIVPTYPLSCITFCLSSTILSRSSPLFWKGHIVELILIISFSFNTDSIVFEEINVVLFFFLLLYISAANLIMNTEILLEITTVFYCLSTNCP